MSYTKREWATGNVVGAVDLNRIENGIEDAGSGQILVVTDTDGALDKTWQEIYDAFPNCYLVTSDAEKKLIASVLLTDYSIYVTNKLRYISSSSNGYPEYKMPK